MVPNLRTPSNDSFGSKPASSKIGDVPKMFWLAYGHRMPRPRIPLTETLIYCIACRKPQNGRGWHGPGCMCELPPADALRGAHGAGTGTRNLGIS